MQALLKDKLLCKSWIYDVAGVLLVMILLQSGQVAFNTLLNDENPLMGLFNPLLATLFN